MSLTQRNRLTESNSQAGSVGRTQLQASLVAGSPFLKMNCRFKAFAARCCTTEASQKTRRKGGEGG